MLLYPDFISYKLSGETSTNLQYLSNHSFFWDFKKENLNNFAKRLKLNKYLPDLKKKFFF